MIKDSLLIVESVIVAAATLIYGIVSLTHLIG